MTNHFFLWYSQLFSLPGSTISSKDGLERLSTIESRINTVMFQLDDIMMKLPVSM